MKRSEIEVEYRKMVRAFAGGFHPDTPADFYESYPEGYTPERVEDLTDEAFDVGIDLYEVALEESGRPLPRTLPDGPLGESIRSEVARAKANEVVR